MNVQERLSFKKKYTLIANSDFIKECAVTKTKRVEQSQKSLVGYRKGSWGL